MQVILTLILAFVLVVAISLGLLHLGRNRLRQRPEKLLALIQQARSGQLQENAWIYALAQPYLHDPEVDEIRHQLLEVEKHHWAGKTSLHHHQQDFLFDAEGLKELQRIEFRLSQLLDKRQPQVKKEL
ncbi:hypothetical protein [Marinospirillum perlucidum]|uniref:hypothetical protein n=1 Tax=Marinospirillum perlucidum TaxID=1982602 RepID=UPI000DF4782A|nr:hypothetical protein [Marinospirillum perlucidum]